MAMFSLRILTVDSYQCSPISGYDDCYSDFRGCEIYNVPVLTLFGTTQAGQKGAIHVHGVFPYIYLRWNDVFPGVSIVNRRKYLQELALEIDKALNVEAAKSNCNKHHVHNITIEKKRSIYGFHAETEDFLKILFYYPWDTSRVAGLLYKQTILDKFIQPYEAHFPFSFQFFVDYNLFGMNTINLSAFKFRTPSGTDAPTVRTSLGMSSFLSESSPSFSKIWNIASLPSSQVNNLPKRVYSELEVDCCEDAIVNKYELASHVGKNPGLVEIREDLKRQRKLANQSSQLTPIPTQERDIEITESELFYKRILKEIIQRNETAAKSLPEENNKTDVNGSQRSLIHSSSESFGLSNTQDQEVLKLLVNMCEDHGPEDDSILATKIDSESDDDEVTNEMSQQFVDDILNAQVSSQSIDFQNPMHSSHVFLNSINAAMPSGCQEEFHMAQVDGAYDGDNETFEGPKLSKEEETNVNTEMKEPPVLHPIQPRESLQQSWTMPCSVKMTDIATINSSKKLSLTFPTNTRPKSKALHAPLVKRASCSGINKNERLQKKKMTIYPSVRILLKDLISKVVENESVNGGLKAKNYLQLNEDKTAEPKVNADCALGARPKTRISICSPLEKSCVMKKLSVGKVSTIDSGTLPSKSASCNDLLKPSEFIDRTCMEFPSSSKHSTDCRPKMKNGKFHSESHANKIYSDKDKNYELHLNSSKEKSAKKSTSLTKLSASIDNKYKKKDLNDRQNVGLADSDPTKFKKSSHDHNKFHSSHGELPVTKSPNSFQTFGTLETNLILGCNVLDYNEVKNVNFSKLGREVVVLKKLTEKEISDLKSGCSEINQNLISVQASTESKKDKKEMKNEKNCYKIFDKNKLKPSYLNHIDSLNLKKSSGINTDNTLNKELSFSEIKNSYDTDSDHSGFMGVSVNESILDNTDSKKFKNVPYTLNNVTPAFRLTGIIDEELFTLEKDSESSLFNNGMFVSQNDDRYFGPEALSGHQSTTSLSNAKESDEAINCKNVLDSDVCILETTTNSSQLSGNGHSMSSVSASNLKPEFQKCLKDNDHKRNSGGKHRKKNKKGKWKGKKIKSTYDSNEKLDAKYALHKLSKYNDFIKDSELAFQNSLDERNVDYFPKAKAVSPNANLLINSATKMSGNDSNLNNKVIKPRAVSSPQEANVPTRMDKINEKFRNIIKNSPYVKLVDCKKFIEENHPENLHLLSKKNRLFQNKEQRICNSSKVFSESKTKKFQIPRKEGSSSNSANKNEFKHKFKNTQHRLSSSSKKRNPGYSKLDILSLPVKSKADPDDVKSSDDVLPFPGKLKSGIDCKLEVDYSPSNTFNRKIDSQVALPFAVKSKPSFKSSSVTDLPTNNMLPGRSVNPKISGKSDIRNNLHMNYASSELTSSKIGNEINKNSFKYTNSTFSNCIPSHSSKPSSSKNSNNHRLPEPDCIIVGEMKTNEASENKIPSKPKHHHRVGKNKIPSQWFVKEENDLKNSLTDNSFEDDCDTKSKVGVTNESNDLVLIKGPEVKPSSKIFCEPKLNSSNSRDNSIITTNDLYDTVKRRTASKSQLAPKFSLKPDSPKKLNNNKSGKVVLTNSKSKTSKKNHADNQKKNLSFPSAKSDNHCPSSCEKEDSFSTWEGGNSVLKEKESDELKNTVSVTRKETLFSFLNNNRSCVKQEPVPMLNGMNVDRSALIGSPQISEDITAHNSKTVPKSPGPSNSTEFFHSDDLSTNNPILEDSNGNQPSLLLHTTPACGSLPTTSSKSILSRPSKGRASKMSGIPKNFGFFSSKTPQRNRRCQNDSESLQFTKPISSRLSLKLNKKNDFPNERKSGTSQQDSRAKWKIDGTLLDHSSQGCDKSTSSEMNRHPQSSETNVLPQNISIKSEPPDDYDCNKNHVINDALKCFDFDEGSSSDPSSFTFSHSKRTRNRKDQKNQQMAQLPKHERNASKTNAQCSLPSISESNKGDIHLNTPSTSLCNSSVNNDRYPKRNRSVSSNVDDDIVILDETLISNTSSSRRTRRSSRLLSSNNTGPKEVIDLEKEDVCMNPAPVITIKRDSEGNNSIVPNKRCNISANNVNRPECLACTQPSTSSSSCFCAADSSDILGSRNSVDDSSSSPDSKHGLKLKLKLKTIMTRNNEPKIVVVGKHLNGEYGQENDMQNHCDIAIKVEEDSEFESKTKRTLGVRNSKRRSKTNTDAEFTPPLPILNIKKEKEDIYEKSYVQPLKFSLSAINATQTEKPSASLEPKCEPLRLYRRSNNFYLESDTSNKRKMPNSTDENPSKETEVIPKRRRGRPAKVQKSAPPQNDLSPLKNDTSFNKNSNSANSTDQILGTSSPDQLSDIGRRCAFPISDNIEECCYEKVGPDRNFDWLKVKIKQEPVSDHENSGRADNNVNANCAPSLENNASATTSRRRNSLRCESFKKFFDSGSDDDTKPKSGPKPQKKKTRSKSVNIETNIKKQHEKQPNEMPSFSGRRTRTRSGSFKKYFNGSDGNSDSDCKYAISNTVVKTNNAPRRKRGRPPLLRNRQLCTNTPPSCNPCSVTLERLSPSLLKQGNSSRRIRKQSNFEASHESNLNSAVGGIQPIPDLNSNSIPSCSIQNNESTIYIRPPCIGNDITGGEPHVLNSEKSDFEILHSKVMGERITPVLQPSVDKNRDTRFIPESGPVTINGLNSINIDSNFSELLSKKEIPDNQMNCPSYMYNSPLNPDSSILTNQNSANFLRPPSREMDQRVFESPSDILRSGSMDCQSPLLYSHSPIADAKHMSEFSPDNKFLHLNQSSPQAYSRQQDLIHSPVMNSDPIFDHCNSPLKEVIAANENLQENDFNRTMQRRNVNSYYSNCSDSYNEGSVIHKSKTKHNMFANDICDSFHSNDFSKEQHNSPCPFESNSLGQNEDLSGCAAKGFDTYDKIPKSQHDSLNYLGKTFSGREKTVNSCFPSNYSESRKPFHSIPKQTRLTYEGSNRESSPYSRFPSSYGSPAGVQLQQPYSTHNQTNFNNSFHQRADESLNSFQNHNEYYDRMKWENLNISSFSNTNDSYSENSKSPFSAHQNRYDNYYAKNNSDLNGSSRMNIDSFCKQKWPEVNTPYFSHGDRPLNEFPRNDRSLDEFSLDDRPVNDIFQYQSPQAQPESNKYDISYPNINNQVSTSSEALDRTKTVNINFSRFSTLDCNPGESKEFQNAAGKKYENTFDKNIEAFFNQHGFTSNSSEIQSSSPVSHASPQLGASSSPFRIDSTVVFNKKVDFNTESNDTGCSFIEVCKPSPCSSLSDQLDSVKSPSLINSSPLCMASHSASVIEKFKVQEIIEELSSPCVEDVKEVKNSPEICGQKMLSPNNSREVPVVSSDSGNTMSDCSTILKSPDSLSKNVKISFNEQNVREFEMNLDSVQEDFLLSDPMISEDESFLMDDNIFPNSPETKVDEHSLIPVGSKVIDDVCNIPKTTSTENLSAQIAEADQTSLNYIGGKIHVLNFQECLTENDPDDHLNPFLGDLSLDYHSQNDNNITNKENDSNNCVAPTDISVKDDLSDSGQTAVKTQNNSSCPLFVETVPNINVIVTDPSGSASDPSDSFVSLESHKNSTVTVSNSLVNETSFSQSTSTFNPIGPTFLSTLMVNESIVLPQSNFFFNNGSIIIGDDSSVKQNPIKVFQNPGTDKSYSVASASEVDSQDVENLKKSFNGEDDILSMIVKSCDIGEEFDEKFDSPDESVNNVVESSSILSATETFDAASNFSSVADTDSIPNSFPINNMKKITVSSQDLPSNHVQKVESAILSHELSEQINEYMSEEKSSEAPSSVSSPNQPLEPSQDKDSIQESAILDSMIQSFYGEETIYNLNASENCDSLSFCSNVHIYNASLDELNKDNLKSVARDFSSRYGKGIVIISPSQSSDLPGNGNYTLIAKAGNISIGNGSSWKSQLNLNDKLEIKKPTNSILDETNEIDLQKMLMKPGGSPPHYVRIVIWIGKPMEATTCSSPEGTPSQTSESAEHFQPSENQSAQKLPSVVNQQLMITPKTDHGVLRQLLSKGVSLESTPNQSCSKVCILDRLLLSPISKDNLLTNDIKKKRKLSFDDDASEQSELPEIKKLKGVHERSLKKSLISDQPKDISRNLTSSEIDGPTLINSRDFRINIEDCERVKHEAQHLTIMSLEIHVNTRNTLSPDPEHDPVAVIFYTIYNEMETFQQEIVGLISIDQQPENNGLRNTRTSLTNYLNLVPEVKTCQVTCVEEEKLLFEKLTSVVREWDPDLLIGYEIQMSSWGYLIERAKFLKINLINMLSRFSSEKKEKLNQVHEENNAVDQTADIDHINIPGRIVLNVWRLMRKEITLNVYTFENVYYHVLHKRTPKYSFHDLSKWYCGHQKETIIRYYVIRILGTIQILEKLDLIRRTSELARLFGIQFYEVLSRGSQFRVESMMLRTAAPMGFVAVSPSVQQRSHSRAPECVPLILEPQSKFYLDPVLVLDFQSLYPSISISNNYCFSTCLGRIGHFDKNVPFEFGCTSLEFSAAFLKYLVEKDLITISPQGIVFVKADVRRGILPTMLEEILFTRVMVKQSMKNAENNALKKLLDARQLGLKLIANVTYGYTAASYSGRMFCVEVADSIVGKARETLERAIRLIENTPEWRAKVVYGDTDSLFVLLPGRTKEEAFKIGQDMADAVTKTNPRPVKLKFEKVYHPCVLQTKKRYVGFMYETINQEKPIFDAKGIETVRRDSCPATAKILEKSLKILFETRDINSVKNYVLKQFLCVMNGRINLMDFIFAKEYRGLSGYKPGACVPALEIAKRRINKDPRSEPRTGERVPYVVTYGLPGLPIIRLVHEPGDLLMNPNLRINATYYITRVISPPLERIFSLMGANVKTWYSAIAHTQKLNLPMFHYPRGTITQYFVTRNCPSCDCPITSSLCDNCCHDQAGTAADLQHKIRKWERAVNHLNQICVSCIKSNSSVDHCSSMDCPVLFKRNLAKKDFSQAPYLRKILTHELF